MGLFKKYVGMTKNPEGILGRMMLTGMNIGHSKMADWGISHLNMQNPKMLLELGCGGGRNIDALLGRYLKAYMTAIDISPLSVERASKKNKKHIADGRCFINTGNVSKLEFPDDTYELATAFETIYFWQDLDKCFTEIYRVLKSGGAFMITNEADGSDDSWDKIIDGMKTYTIEQITGALNRAGFMKITSYHHESKPWICVIAEK